MNTNEHEVSRKFSSSGLRRWKRLAGAAVIVVPALILALCYLFPIPCEGLRVLSVASQLRAAMTAQQEFQAFGEVRAKTRIWEMSFKGADGQPISWEEARKEPSRASVVCIEWLGLIRDPRIEHRLINPTNLLVLCDYNGHN
jgi:hypothetical protein